MTGDGRDEVGVEVTGDRLDKVGVTGGGKEIWVDAGSPVLLPTDPEVKASEIGVIREMEKKIIIITLDVYLFSAHVH